MQDNAKEKRQREAWHPFTVFRALLSFSLWSLRGRAGQMLPVTVALLLLVGAVQGVGALGDVSSQLTRQQIARNWRDGFDLLVRSQQAVSQAERGADWLNPSSLLENYGGISPEQVTLIRSLPQVARAVLYANAGWQSVDVVVPVIFTQRGMYRMSALWDGVSPGINYLEVIDLAHLTHETPISSPIVQHVVLPDGARQVVYEMQVPAVQDLIGVEPEQQGELQKALLNGSTATTQRQFTIHIEKLVSSVTMLSACVNTPACWQSMPSQQSMPRYQADGTQLLRYSRSQLSASSQQASAGEVTLEPSGRDSLGALYRTLLPAHVVLPSGEIPATGGNAVLPFSMPAHAPLLPTVAQFIPLQQACAINGKMCYSGLFVQLTGVSQYSQQSLARLQAAAAMITSRTGLHVDILDGSSLRAITLMASDGKRITSTSWRALGVAVQIVHGVDTVQATLLALSVVICLLALGAAGVLVGITRRNEASTLRQTGWSRPLLIATLLLDALLLSLPGLLLASGWILLAYRLWSFSLPSTAMWGGLLPGMLVYALALVVMGCNGMPTARRPDSTGRPPGASLQVGQPHPSNGTSDHRHMEEGNTTDVRTPLAGVRRPFAFARWPFGFLLEKAMYPRHSRAFHLKVIAPLTCAVAVVCVVFLIAMNYLMVMNFDRSLVVTALGRQVQTSLEGPQLQLMGMVFLTALIIIAQCSALLLHGKRGEIVLLAKIGWERQDALRYLLKDTCLIGLLSGEMGALLALIAVALTSSLPQLIPLLGMLLGGPLLGVMLVGSVMAGIAQKELARAFV